MPHDHEHDLDDGLDPEGPSADDLERFGGDDDPCPACGRAVYHDMAACPHCGADLDGAASARVGRIPAWGVWVVVAGVLAAFLLLTL
jgi:hypothetical protein